MYPEEYEGDDRVSVVFVGEGGALNGEESYCLNSIPWMLII